MPTATASNNDLGAGEFKARASGSRYQGGDLKGLAQRLDYIRGLGATALWITPPVANQWLNPSGDYSGYHGYWAQNFLQVDKHLGTLADYRDLSHALHSQGLYLVQDIVVNHMGNFFTYRDRWAPGDPAQGWEAHDQTPPVPRPSQPPFDQNDPRSPKQRQAAAYHWTPDISDYNNPVQEHGYQMGGLDDINTESPAVRRALRRSYGHWIKQVGVDAFRVDTAFYVPPAFFDDFLNARETLAPGMARVARSTGRQRLHVFGEGFGIDKPGQDTQARKIEGYITGQAGALKGRPLLPGMLNFPLYGAFNDVFARGKAPADLADRIQRTMAVHRQPHLMVNFVDNHDVDRFLAAGDSIGLQQALLAMFTLPGIPALYYGTEQGFTEQRASMFAAGWGSGGRDHYDTSAPLYRALADMAALRRQHRVLSRGMPVVLRAQAGAPGALAWKMVAAHDTATSTSDGSRRTSPPSTLPGASQVLVVFNTASHTTLLDRLETGLPSGTRLQGAYSAQGGLPDSLTVQAKGQVSLALAPRSAQVWVVHGGARASGVAPSAVAALARPAAAVSPVITPLPAQRVQADFDIEGDAAPGSQHLKLVVDGDLDRATALAVDTSGRWRARVDTAEHINPAVQHRLVVWDADTGAASEARPFYVERSWQLQADVADPAGDDIGPGGTFAPYTYPTHPSWGARRQMDLRRVRVFTSGGALRVAVQMPHISTTWNPPNGFDHVAFTLFIELPGQGDGSSVMPLQNGITPDGMRWHVRLRANGWTNALFSHTGANAQNEGQVVAAGASISVNPADNEVVFTLPAAALGRPTNLAGARLWINTWDYDGGYRALGPTAQEYTVGGAAADPAQPAPKLMDSSAVISLR